MRLVLVAALTAAFAAPCFPQTSESHSPQLLLTSQRLRRLKRDHTRQTERWLNFENRVKTVPDSPERGFELALDYAITGEQARGREAIVWAKNHGCDRRQVALVLDWTSDLLSREDRRQLTGNACTGAAADTPRSRRDALFAGLATDADVSRTIADTRSVLPRWLTPETVSNPAEFYAVCEFLDVVKSAERIDLRQDLHVVFSGLPQEFLLRLKPEQQEHPGWMTHAAALALVDLDPNLEGSQYLQGWALQDSQMVRDGPGVAYELLWADPYLPGVSYQNMDPWVYEPGRGLLARAGWTPQSCWIDVSAAGIKEENCPPRWQDKSVWFGRLNLMPVAGSCIALPERKTNTALILWKLRPHQALSYQDGENTPAPSVADDLGLWNVPTNAEGKVCLKREGSSREARH